MNSASMVSMMAHHWWVIALRGGLAVLFGLAALIWPGVTLEMLVLLFGGYTLTDGFLTLVSALMGGQSSGQRGWLVLAGLVDVGVGVITFVWPGVTALALLYMIAGHAIMIGILHIRAAIRLRQEIDGEWRLLLSGLAALLFGVGLVIFPGAGALAIISVIGVYAILTGLLLMAVGWRVRGLRDRPEQTVARPV